MWCHAPKPLAGPAPRSVANTATELCRILREYLREEVFVPEAAGAFDFERVVDDFVLLCVLVGNDFLPHSPTLDIGEGAMDVIFETYRDSLVRNGHHLTQGERISHVQLEVLLAALAEKESDTLVQRAQVCCARFACQTSSVLECGVWRLCS